MKKRIYLILTLLVMFYACSSPAVKKAAEPAVQLEKVEPEIYSVEMVNMKFSPEELKVKKGDKVVFVNHDMMTHDVTEESKKAWSSSPLTTDKNWVLEVTESVNYYCSIHPVMKGKIIVE